MRQGGSSRETFSVALSGLVWNYYYLFFFSTAPFSNRKGGEVLPLRCCNYLLASPACHWGMGSWLWWPYRRLWGSAGC